MSLPTDPRPQPNPEIYDFESQFEDAFSMAMVAHNFKAAEKQQGDNLDTKLTTPRVECQFLSGQQSQRSYIVPTTAWAYPNVWSGTMRTKIVTNRLKQGRKGHRQLRGMVRWVYQQHDVELTARMKNLTVVQAIESGTTPEFQQTESEDISSMSHAVIFNIKPSAFPTPG